MNKCQCGCGQKVTHKGNKYLQGHHTRVNNPFIGKHHSEETKDKVRQTREINGSNKKQSELMERNNPMNYKKYRDKLSESCKGRVITIETREKMSMSLDGRILSEEHKINISEMVKGENNPMFGRSGSLCPAWLGGVSFEPYGTEFNTELKSSIREHDNHTCQLCKTLENGTKLDVHHIDYNKKNNDESNLISLCKSCHMKTNSNREYWKIKFMRVET